LCVVPSDVTSPSASARLGRLLGPGAALWADPRPIREELFGVERLEEHARSLAAVQLPTLRPGRSVGLWRRLADNERALVAAYRDVGQAVDEGALITPAAEWLLDNFHVVEEQIRNIRSNLPRGYYRQLPKLASGPFHGLPQVFSLAWAFVAHTDSLFDPEALRRFVRAYQDIRPLTIGELWALPITLRLVLVENLRRIADRVVIGRAARREADIVAARLLGQGGVPAEPAAEVLRAYERGASLPEAFFVQLVQRLRDQPVDVGAALEWIDARLAARESSAEAMVRDEQQRQVAASVTVRNIVTSMRYISEVDWTELVERFSLVDDLLASGSGFAAMDFPTRNLYRTAIEELARGTPLSEIEVAQAALDRARRAGGPDARRADPGYYLLAGGRATFEQSIGYRPPWPARPARLYRSLGIGGYVGGGFLAAALVLALALAALATAGVPTGWLAVAALLGVVPAVDLGVALVNHVVTRGFVATRLPALALDGGIPDEQRTLLVVPTLLTTVERVEAEIEQLEIHFLASPPGALHLALLTDWPDAPCETMPADAALLDAARAGIARLNARHGPAPAGDRFLLLHRRRRWSAGEGCWMGWERKRGKLWEMNRLLRGATDTCFIDPPRPPAGIRYVITLDSDTRLPRDTVGRLVGKMAHPLNRPRFDAAAGRVVEGYGILQPRVTPALPAAGEGSWFLRIFSSASGIDPYAAAVSDVYQDLFGEGSYTGKGIYDVDAFEAALAGRVPEGALLSHDLFEGIFVRAGLASDVEVVEDYPGRYDVSTRRHHRWARGDWQLLPWIIGPARRSVPAIGRWKMLDNLRRSLSAPALLAGLVAGWLLPAGAGLWTLFLLLTMALPPLLPIADRLRRRPGVPLGPHLHNILGDLQLAGAQQLLMLLFLCDQAMVMADAIGRTLWRLLVSRRHMLQWVPTALSVAGPRLTIGLAMRQMWPGQLLAGAVAAVVVAARSPAAPIALVFALGWLGAPVVAVLVSRPRATAGRRPLTPADADMLRLVARQTWRYFETFVNRASNMLPPDNFQESPQPVVAERTSPTNIGLYLLSTTSAHDFGWIGLVEAVERIEATLATIGRMEMHRGHLYNWYATADLRPLHPRYVSSVDSGNLAGHLLAVAGAAREWRERGVGPRVHARGIRDCLDLARHADLAWRAAGPRGSARARLEVGFDHFIGALHGGAAADLATLDLELEPVLDAVRALAIEEDAPPVAEIVYWVEATRRAIRSQHRDAAAAALGPRLEAIEVRCRALAHGMDFAFLMDPDRLLLSIGYLVDDGRRDSNCYDLLASEARLASFLAIAKGDVPTRHWFRLGRTVTRIAHGAALISWSGSMFEYLMPSLVMRAPHGTLLEQTSRLIVNRQIEYGRMMGTPWGVSEAAYNARDLEYTYQYSNFGVPGLGLKRGLAENMVIAPYATGLAAMVDPEAAARNFEALSIAGGRGRHGFYEALDFTPSRVPEGRAAAVVETYMAHHQAMTITGIANALDAGRLRARFHAEPMVQATELLLQERVPRDVVQTPPSVAETAARRPLVVTAREWRSADPWAAAPEVQLLSNGRWTTVLTAAGSGFLQWGDNMISRWRSDPTRDDWGPWLFLRDAATGRVWSATVQPFGEAADATGVVFNENHADFRRTDGPVTTQVKVLVSAEDDAEVRRVIITNESDQQREIEICSYIELALAPAGADMAHPLFSRMFVETGLLPGPGALIAHRRRRSAEDPGIWAGHLAVVDGEWMGVRDHETDRARFIGRGRDAQNPAAILSGRPLSGTVGAVLDPVFAVRRRVRLSPGRSARIDFWTMAAASRAELLALIDKHQDMGAFERAETLAWTQSQVQLHHLGIDHDEARLFQELGGRLLFPGPALRPPSDTIVEGAGAQSDLWGMGISGDLPIILLRLDGSEQTRLVREVLLAVEYLRMKRLAVDLVILNERSTSYVQDLQAELEMLVRASQSRMQATEDHAAGHIFILRGDLLAAGARALLLAVARVVLVGERGRLSDQIEAAAAMLPAQLPRPLRPHAISLHDLRLPRPAPDIQYFNGTGGFALNGREYVVFIGPGQTTPAPWINVIANPEFGFLVSAEGGGFTWAGNAREHQITPWSNDPVVDPAGQALYVRDLDSGEIWTPTARPRGNESGTYVCRHGHGYSRFEHASAGLALDLLEFVPLSDPVRIARLAIRNTGARARRLSVTAYVEWVLGNNRPACAPFVQTEIDAETGALFAANRWNAAFGARTAFLDIGGRQTSWTGDRREFIGRNGTTADPAALLSGAALSGRVGGGLDPCGAMQTIVELAPGAAVELVVTLGEGAQRAAAVELVRRWRSADIGAEFQKVRSFWDETLGQVQVRTPDRSMDILLNGWLLYQALACRLWARTGFYQASGAYGFRDQLQDVMALFHARPEIARAQLLRASAQQFPQGDVLHWWLPHSGQGVRTRMTDDRLWLPYVAVQYVAATGDQALYDEMVPFLDGPPLAPGQQESFFQPSVSAETATFYEHGARAIDISLTAGRHGIPLIGAGDWNDGMNRVGEKGEGESVWLGWFTLAVIAAFAPVAEARGDAARARRWRDYAATLAEALDREAWDGEWYKRGWFDDGTPLGSAESDECRIDSIAQSWAVLSGAAAPERAARAMEAVERELIRPEEAIALLFAPPFDRTMHDPGYIKGYPPGMRENGGQYTHAALWAVMALARLGEGDKAAALFWMLNPLNHSRTRTDAHRYKGEPYVVAADVYSAPAHVGRAGWTWYTGSAAWMQRAGIESILGVRIEAGVLRIDPVIPADWPQFEVDVRFGTARYEIKVDNPDRVSSGVVAARLDGAAIGAAPLAIEMQDDGRLHRVAVTMGTAHSAAA
jgi:cyclic beta-1,2-glucan synthetase